MLEISPTHDLAALVDGDGRIIGIPGQLAEPITRLDGSTAALLEGVRLIAFPVDRLVSRVVLRQRNTQLPDARAPMPDNGAVRFGDARPVRRSGDLYLANRGNAVKSRSESGRPASPPCDAPDTV